MTNDIASTGWPTLRAALITCLLGAPALAQSIPTHAHHPHRAHRHLPAAPPAQPADAARQADATAPAPVPNEAVTPPLENKSPSANVAPSVFQLHYPPQGEGYVTGSSPQAMDDRNAAKATGVQATVPLPQ